MKMEAKTILFQAIAIISSLVYLGVIFSIMFFFGWITAIIFGLLTGFFVYKMYSIYEKGTTEKDIVGKMERRKEEGVFIGGKKFNLNKGVIHGDEIPGEDSKPNLGDLDQLVPKPLPGTKKKVTKRKQNVTKKNTKKKVAKK